MPRKFMPVKAKQRQKVAGTNLLINALFSGSHFFMEVVPLSGSYFFQQKAFLSVKKIVFTRSHFLGGSHFLNGNYSFHQSLSFQQNSFLLVKPIPLSGSRFFNEAISFRGYSFQWKRFVLLECIPLSKSCLLYQKPFFKQKPFCLVQNQRCSLREIVLRYIAKFTRKHLCQSLFLNKVAEILRNF